VSRQRTVSNEVILEAVGGLLQQGGPAALTFASAAAACGLSPATLVQRYGSREAMIRAALLQMWDQLDRHTVELDAQTEVSPEGAIAMLVRLSNGYGAEGDPGQGLLLLREDFRDPVLRERGAAWGAALTAALGRRLTDDPAAAAILGGLMAGQWQGAVLWWGFSREGTLRGYLRREFRRWLAAMGPQIRVGTGGNRR
jgi:AcrR family transcriptional regulator